MSNPLISVIVPVYKAERYLDRCVRSILEQTYQNLEIILVDDGSPDSSPQRCDFWAEQDCRVRVIHKDNGGASSARNAGLELCIGEYITFVDSDDWIEREYYQNVICVMMKYGMQIGCAGRYDVDEATLAKTVGLCPASQRVLTAEQMLQLMLTWRECDFSACDKIFAASLWENIRFPVGKSSEDVGILYQIVGRANGVVLHPQPVYHYFHRHGSVTAVNQATKNTHIVEFADEICTYVQERYPIVLKEAQYFKMKCLLYWHRAFLMNPAGSGSEFELFRTSRIWLREHFGFILFSCEYVSKKDKLWYLLILLKMKKIVQWLLQRHEK